MADMGACRLRVFPEKILIYLVGSNKFLIFAADLEQDNQALMNIFYLFYVFVSNGIKTFRAAAIGSYNGESKAIRQMREDVMCDTASDSERLRCDWKNVGRDVRTSYNKLIFPNG
ncbi:MAG: hypothetical protein K2G76_03110 [Prevotella sp.]|nr:hypothetical protein [Prevotella sp.]